MARSILLATILITTTLHAQVMPRTGFMENKGQFDDHILFACTNGYDQILITAEGLDLLFKESTSGYPAFASSAIHLKDAHVQKENAMGSDALPGYSNHYRPNCPQGVLGVRSWRTITFINVYPGIDWAISLDDGPGLVHDFIVHPGADPGLIQLEYYGNDLLVASDGRLILKANDHLINEGPLHVYDDGTGETIVSAFNIQREAQERWNVSYTLGAYDTNNAIIIDPPLQWSSPQSSTEFDQGYAIVTAKDGSGDVIITGSTWGSDFPDTLAWQNTLSGPEDLVVVRLDENGDRRWATYYGGSDNETGRGITTDASGSVYVTGTTGSTDMPVENAFQPVYGGGVYDALLLAFDANGVRQWASFHGGQGADVGMALISDDAAMLYVTGYTNSSDMPLAGTPIQATMNTGNDGFIMKLSTLPQLEWCTFFGGNDDDKIRAITIDQEGDNIFLTGSTTSSSFPSTNGVFQQFSASGLIAEDAFITKLGSDQTLQFSSFCGGVDADFGQGIAVDPEGNIYITGYTFSVNYPVAHPGGEAYVDSIYNGVHDAFITQCNSNGSSLLWSTYYGGSSSDLALATAFDPNVGLYICGHSISTDLEVHQSAGGGYFQNEHSDGGTYNDMFIVWFGMDQQIEWSTYYGATESGDDAYGIALNAEHDIFITGLEHNDLAVLKFSSDLSVRIPEPDPSLRLHLHPNPVQDQLTIDLDLTTWPLRLEVWSTDGGSLLRSTLNKGAELVLDVSALPAGAYFLNVVSCDLVTTERFVKVR